MQDAAIIRLYFARDERAISETAQKYGSYCAAIANNILTDRLDAEECVNDTWLRTWNAIPPQRPRQFSAFLGKITRNLSLSRYRARTAEKRGGGQTPLVLDELAELVSDTDTVEQQLAYRELVAALNAFLGKLPGEKRALFLRRYWYFDPICDIAARFGMTENNVCVTLSRLRQQLRRTLTEGDFAL